jgi:NADH dehydrogenase (ubiquinone) 1 alpha subcomplex subunit 6
MREEFEKNRYVDNLDVINTLLVKGQAEFEETIHMWKTVNHVMKYFKDAEDLAEERKKSGDFLTEFYSAKK